MMALLVNSRAFLVVKHSEPVRSLSQLAAQWPLQMVQIDGLSARHLSNVTGDGIATQQKPTAPSACKPANCATTFTS